MPGRRRALIIGGIGAVAVIAVIAALAVVLLGSAGGASYLTQARNALTPVFQDNHQLAGAFSTLAPDSSPGPVKASVQTTIGAAQAAQHTLGVLSPGSADRQFAANAQAALTSELAWLNAAASVLANPASPMLAQLGSLGVDAQTQLQAIDAQIPGASSSFPGSIRLISYAQAQTAAASTKSAHSQFSSQVQALLTQSGPAFVQINQLFAQLQTAANGGTPTITLAQAEATLTTVVANRTALAASARTLNAPTPLSISVRAALVAAMDASLTNDQDISNCLNQANNGTVAYIFQGCLSSTAADSAAATTAKQNFLTLYNNLRQQIGQPATSAQF